MSFVYTSFSNRYFYLFSGVADGVGGWRNYGIDPGEFSSLLMRTCERLVSSGRFSHSDPANLLANSYYELLEHKQPVSGIILCNSISLVMFINLIRG